MGGGHRHLSYAKPQFFGSWQRELRLRRQRSLDQYLLSPYDSGRLDPRLGVNTAVSSAVAPRPGASGVFKPNRGIQGSDYRRADSFFFLGPFFPPPSLPTKQV